MSDRAKSEWKRVLLMVAGRGTMIEVDTFILQRFCTTLKNLAETRETLARDGLTSGTGAKIEPHPAVKREAVYRQGNRT